MKVTRKVTFNTKEVCAGDQITIKLKGFGKFTATCGRIENGKALFIFDQIITRRSINPTNTNKGGINCSEIKSWLNNVVLLAFPTKLRAKTNYISLPSYGMVFGHGYDKDFYDNYVTPDNDERFEHLKKRVNRVREFTDPGDEGFYVSSWWLSNPIEEEKSSYVSSWWLSNLIKEEKSSARFAYVSFDGNAGYSYASDSFGVCPVFEVCV